MLSIPEMRSSKFYDGTPVTVCRIPINASWQKIYVVTQFVLFFLIPFLLLFTLNCHLCFVLQTTQECDTHLQESSRRDRKRRQQQAVNIVALIVSIFFVCHLPFRVAVLWFSFEDAQVIFSLGLEKYLNILYSTRIMFYLNHALNPVVYNFVSTKFRCALRDVCSPGRNRERYLSVANDKCKRHKSTVFINNTPFPCARNTILATNIMSKKSDNRPTVARETINDFNPNLKMAELSSRSNDASSSFDKDYDGSIRMDEKTVSIKFNV